MTVAKKRGGGFREGALLAKLQKLQAEGKADKIVKEIEGRVPPGERSAWLWGAYGRGALPQHWSVDDLLAQHVDGVPVDVLGAALASAAAGEGAASYLPGVPARSQIILLSACRQDKANHLRRSVDAMPHAVGLATWIALAGEAKVPAPPEIVREVREMLPDHLASGRMHGLELGLVCVWLGIDAKDLYEPVVRRLPEIERIPLLTFACVLLHMPAGELARIADRIEIGTMQPSWVVWFMEQRRAHTDSPRDNLAVFEALRPTIEAAPSWMRTTCLDQVGLGVAKALLAAGERVPDAVLEIGGDATDLVDRWWPVYSTLPAGRVRALRDALAAKMEGYRKTFLMPLAGLLGEVEVLAALDQTETAITTGNSVSNHETGLLGAIGAPVIAPLRARLAERTRALPQGKNPHGDAYWKLAVVAGLRSALAVALGKVAEAGAPIEESFDGDLLPSPEVYGSHHDDHVSRFLTSDSRRMQSLFGALPEPRVRRFVEAWLAFDRSGRHMIRERLERVLPESRHHLLRGGPSQVELLRRLAEETGLPCTAAVYAMTRDEQRRQGSLNTVRSSPNGLARADWPSAGGQTMEAALSLDLGQVPELQRRWPSARALCLFVDRPDEGFDASVLLPLSGAQCEAGFSNEGDTFTLEKIPIPPEVFGPREALGPALETLREGLDALPGRVLGAATLIQEAEVDDRDFILQAGELLTRLNLGDVGELYVFSDGVFWQCH